MTTLCSEPSEASPSIIPATPLMLPHRLHRLDSVFDGAILTPAIAPSQAIAIDEDYVAWHTSIINARLAVALPAERLQPFI